LENFAAGGAGEYYDHGGGDCISLIGLMDHWINGVIACDFNNHFCNKLQKSINPILQ
jgi:hypothetical protein